VVAVEPLSLHLASTKSLLLEAALGLSEINGKGQLSRTKACVGDILIRCNETAPLTIRRCSRAPSQALLSRTDNISDACHGERRLSIVGGALSRRLLHHMRG
jgi:hypothetical protein